MVVLATAQIIGTVGVGIAPSIGVLLASAVTDNESLAGLARTASTLGAALVGVPLGMLAARRGRSIALAAGWWAAAAGAALLVVAAQALLIVPLFAGLLLIGVGSAVSLQSRFAATDLATPRHRARSLSLVAWGGTVGSVLGPNLGVPGQAIGAATGLTTYAAAFGIAAVCLAIAGLIVAIALRPDPLAVLRDVRGATTAPRPRAARAAAARRAIRADPRVRFATVAILTAQIVMVAVMTMTPVHLERHGDSITIIGVTISLHVAGMYALAPVVGMLVDRWGARATIGAGLVIFLASLLSAILWPDETGGVVASLVLLGVGWSFVNVSGSALFSESVPVASRASAQGGIDALSNLCAGLAAFASGPLMTAKGTRTSSRRIAFAAGSDSRAVVARRGGPAPIRQRRTLPVWPGTTGVSTQRPVSADSSAAVSTCADASASWMFEFSDPVPSTASTNLRASIVLRSS